MFLPTSVIRLEVACGLTAKTDTASLMAEAAKLFSSLALRMQPIRPRFAVISDTGVSKTAKKNPTKPSYQGPSNQLSLVLQERRECLKRQYLV